MTAAARAAAELRALRRRFDVVSVERRLAGGTITLHYPANAEALISEEEFEADERLPYWADIWPSAVVLAEQVAAMAGAGRRFLELGCGAGLVATAAARAGFAVCATDYYDDALAFTRVNVGLNAGVEPETRLLDWRALPADLPPADLVAASDVLYERPYAELVAEAFRRTLSAGAVGLLADPGRVALGAFLAAAEQRGVRARRVTEHAFVEGLIRQTIRVHELVADGEG